MPASPLLSSAVSVSGEDDQPKPENFAEASLPAISLTSADEGSTAMEAHAAKIPSADTPDTQGLPGDSKSSVASEDKKSSSESSLTSRVQMLEDTIRQIGAAVGMTYERPPIAEDGAPVPAQKTTPRPLAMKVKELDAERFNSRSPADTAYLIEVLMNDRSKKEHHRKRSRYFASNPIDTDETKMLLQDLPSRIRIRSPFLLRLLEEAAQSSLTYPNEESSKHAKKSPMVFLYPFKFFVTYERQIREKLQKLVENHNANTTEETLKSTSTQDITSRHEKPDVNMLSPKTKEAQKKLEHGIMEIKALIQLFDENLKPIFDLRHGFQEGRFSMILWDHLWLLFTIGGLAFQREPEAGHDPRLLRVAQFHGGRRRFKDEPPHHGGGQVRESKKIAEPEEIETFFQISAFNLESDGASFFPVQEVIEIPPWDGLRQVRELRYFPFEFCQQGGDKDFHQPSKELWKANLIDRGKKFAELGNVAFKYFDGHSFGEEREQVHLLKTHRS